MPSGTLPTLPLYTLSRKRTSRGTCSRRANPLRLFLTLPSSESMCSTVVDAAADNQQPASVRVRCRRAAIKYFILIEREPGGPNLLSLSCFGTASTPQSGPLKKLTAKKKTNVSARGCGRSADGPPINTLERIADGLPVKTGSQLH